MSSFQNGHKKKTKKKKEKLAPTRHASKFIIHPVRHSCGVRHFPRRNWGSHEPMNRPRATLDCPAIGRNDCRQFEVAKLAPIYFNLFIIFFKPLPSILTCYSDCKFTLWCPYIGGHLPPALHCRYNKNLIPVATIYLWAQVSPHFSNIAFMWLRKVPGADERDLFSFWAYRCKTLNYSLGLLPTVLRFMEIIYLGFTFVSIFFSFFFFVFVHELLMDMFSGRSAGWNIG